MVASATDATTKPGAGRPRKATQRATLLGYVAGRLRRRADDNDYLHGVLGLDQAASTVRHVANPRRWKAELHGERFGAGAPKTPNPPLFREWLLVDEQELDLFIELAVIDTGDEDPAAIFQGLREIEGVRQVLSSEGGRAVFAVLIYDTPSERRRIRARLRDVKRPTAYFEIDQETFDPAVATWEELARKAASEGVSAE
jgi:hypothetical protein